MHKYYGIKKQDYAVSFAEGNLIFLSAVDARSPDDGKIISDRVEKQVMEALDKISIALSEAGSLLDNLIKTTVLLKDAADFPVVSRTIQKYYEQHAPSLVKEPPANTVITVGSLAEPQCKAAIEAIAVIDKKKPGWKVQKFYGETPSPAATAGSLLFMSGVSGKSPATGRLPAGFKSQMLNCLEKVRETVEEAGGTLNDVVKVTRIISNLADLPQMWRTEIDYCKKHAPVWIAFPPASTFIQPHTPGKNLIELEATAVIPANKTGWEIKPEWEVLRRPLYYGVRQPFAKSITIGNLVLLSAMHGGRPADGRPALGDLQAQTLAVLDKVRLSMEETGSSLKNIGKTTIFVKNIADYPRIHELMLKYYREHAPSLIDSPPAATVLQPGSLANPYHLIAIEAVGVR